MKRHENEMDYRAEAKDSCDFSSRELKEQEVAEAKRDLEVELEWKEAQDRPSEGSIEVSSNPKYKSICKGFSINYMNMKDADTNELLWQSQNWDADSMFEQEQSAHIPAHILECDAVTRVINFSSAECIKDFRLEQRVYFNGSCLEEWRFKFGFVIPGSTNEWEQTIQSAGKDNMLPAELISGKLTIETGFYDGQSLISKTVVRIYYIS